MPDPPAEARVAPPVPHYLLIDGTNAFDAGIFGLDIERRFGWRNLLDYLPKVPKTRGRLDPGADLPFLPVYRLKVRESRDANNKRVYSAILGKGTAMVMPAGFNGEGRDAFWRSYDPSPRQWDGRWTTRGRQTAAEESARFVHDLVQTPLVQLIPGHPQGAGELVATRDDLFKFFADPPVFHADLVFYSGHGYFGGFMRGENLLSDPQAPAGTQGRYFCKGDPFLLGRAVREKRGFLGPLWLIMAQCSTLNESTWPDWVELFLESAPQVRGVLAYDDLSPSATGTAIVTRRFLDLLVANKQLSLKDAWKQANGGDQNWAALVHKDALGDTFHAWDALERNPVQGRDYVGFNKRVPTGTPVVRPQPPFTVELAHRFAGTTAFLPVRPDNLDRPVGMALAGDAYRITIAHTTPGAAIDEASVELINSRPFLHFTQNVRTPIHQVFHNVRLEDPSRATLTRNQAKMRVTAKAGVVLDRFVIHLDARKPFTRFDTYLWLQVRVKTGGKTHALDLGQVGLRHPQLGH